MQLKNIKLPMAEIAKFCRKWNLTEFAPFGSVLRDDFRPANSDVDVMIQYRPDAVPSFYDLDLMEADLEVIFGRDVDVITRSGVESSANYLRRHEILSSAQIIYESGSSISV